MKDVTVELEMAAEGVALIEGSRGDGGEVSADGLEHGVGEGVGVAWWDEEGLSGDDFGE